MNVQSIIIVILIIIAVIFAALVYRKNGSGCSCANGKCSGNCGDCASGCADNDKHNMHKPKG